MALRQLSAAWLNAQLGYEGEAHILQMTALESKASQGTVL